MVEASLQPLLPAGSQGVIDTQLSRLGSTASPGFRSKVTSNIAFELQGRGLSPQEASDLAGRIVQARVARGLPAEGRGEKPTRQPKRPQTQAPPTVTETRTVRQRTLRTQGPTERDGQIVAGRFVPTRTLQPTATPVGGGPTVTFRESFGLRTTTTEIPGQEPTTTRSGFLAPLSRAAASPGRETEFVAAQERLREQQRQADLAPRRTRTSRFAAVSGILPVRAGPRVISEPDIPLSESIALERRSGEVSLRAVETGARRFVAERPGAAVGIAVGGAALGVIAAPVAGAGAAVAGSLGVSTAGVGTAVAGGAVTAGVFAAEFRAAERGGGQVQRGLALGETGAQFAIGTGGFLAGQAASKGSASLAASLRKPKVRIDTTPRTGGQVRVEQTGPRTTVAARGVARVGRERFAFETATRQAAAGPRIAGQQELVIRQIGPVTKVTPLSRLQPSPLRPAQLPTRFGRIETIGIQRTTAGVQSSATVTRGIIGQTSPPVQGTIIRGAQVSVSRPTQIGRLSGQETRSLFADVGRRTNFTFGRTSPVPRATSPTQSQLFRTELTVTPKAPFLPKFPRVTSRELLGARPSGFGVRRIAQVSQVGPTQRFTGVEATRRNILASVVRGARRVTPRRRTTLPLTLGRSSVTGNRLPTVGTTTTVQGGRGLVLQQRTLPRLRPSVTRSQTAAASVDTTIKNVERAVAAVRSPTRIERIAASPIIRRVAPLSIGEGRLRRGIGTRPSVTTGIIPRGRVIPAPPRERQLPVLRPILEPRVRPVTRPSVRSDIRPSPVPPVPRPAPPITITRPVQDVIPIPKPAPPITLPGLRPPSPFPSPIPVVPPLIPPLTPRGFELPRIDFPEGGFEESRIPQTSIVTAGRAFTPDLIAINKDIRRSEREIRRRFKNLRVTGLERRPIPVGPSVIRLRF